MLRPIKDRIGDNTEARGKCLIWTGPDNGKGYGVISYRGKLQYVHILVYELKHGKQPKGTVIRHTCDTPSCVKLDHLISGTHKDNSDDKYSRGRDNNAKGVQHGSAVLTDDKVRDIRKKYATGKYSYRKLAKEFSVGKTAIEAIVKNKTWTHVK